MEKQASPVELNAAVAAQLNAYCERTGVTAQQLVNDVLAEYLNVNAPWLSEMVDGYVAMSQINTEICHDFSACEAEAYAHIR